MADLHNAFELYHDRLAPTPQARHNLRWIRDTVRERIRKNFKEELKIPPPVFHSQGGLAMGTVIKPLSGVYDIDDGVYLRHLSSKTKSHWPSPEIVHICMHGAAFGRGSEKSENKKACVRLIEPGGYRVDLPVYAELNGRYYLAECGARGWHPSDPIALVEWFVSAVSIHGEQLRRLVRYVKGWADFQSARLGKMPGGLILTVLTVQNYFRAQRDDVCMAMTLRAIESKTRPLLSLLNPMDIGEELTGRLTMAQLMNFQKAVAAAASDADRAIQADCPRQASDLWRRWFGERFPVAGSNP
jgi:hypothetical protein